MQLQNEIKYTKERLEKMSETDSSLANNINDTQKRSLKTKSELETSIKTEVSELNSKIHNGDNKLNKSLSDTNSRITEMFSISGWFRASNNLIYKRFTDSVNYATAKAHCEGMGARLVSTGIRNSQNKSEIFPNQYLTGAYAWIGLDDISSEGTWVWSDGANGSPSAIWESLEPNGGRKENCAVIRLSGVIDVACSEIHRLVCEKEFA
ncbi:lectin-like [Styela clava]